jgi:hypothetical protein
MNRDFLAQCTAIAPLMEGDSDSESGLPSIQIPGIADHVACAIANDVATSSDLEDMCRDKSMRYCLDALLMADFMGHEALIGASAREIATRLEPMSPMDMRCAIGLDPYPEISDTHKADAGWITASRATWRRHLTREA